MVRSLNGTVWAAYRSFEERGCAFSGWTDDELHEKFIERKFEIEVMGVDGVVGGYRIEITRK